MPAKYPPTAEPPPLRIKGTTPRRAHELGPPDLPVPEGDARHQPFDWALVGISLAFLVGATAIFYGGYYVHKGDHLTAGQTKTIANRPNTPNIPNIISPDNRTSAAHAVAAGSAPVATRSPAPAPLTSHHANTPAGTAYDMNTPTVQGGPINTRPTVKVVPGQQRPVDPRTLFMPAPGQLKAPPGVKPVH